VGDFSLNPLLLKRAMATLSILILKIVIKKILGMTIEAVTKTDYPELLAVWESSVRATHHFLAEADIAFFKPLIIGTYFDLVELRCVKNEQERIIGFSGVAGAELEMLFIHAEYRGKGVGTLLLQNAMQKMGVTKVGVNEDNVQALGFYQQFGFEVYDRSSLDGTGKPYPILHLKVKA
jgi:putative acetyltransferase